MKCKECGQPMLPAGQKRPGPNWHRHASGCPLDDYKAESPAMKERPILFSGPMVNAILDGRKTQTRRKCKRQPTPELFQTKYRLRRNYPNPGTSTWWTADKGQLFPVLIDGVDCPYGQPGDRLWVKETWQDTSLDDVTKCFSYRATWRDEEPPEGGWRPSIFMPRRASRILLEITAVRVEQLQDISEEDAVAEGCNETHLEHTEDCSDEHCALAGGQADCCGYLVSARLEYKSLWESINGKGSWEANPWVWVIEFKVLEGGKR